MFPTKKAAPIAGVVKGRVKGGTVQKIEERRG
jgi:hypothetical protein